MVHAFRADATERLLGLGEGGALLAALALGDRGGLGALRRDQFRLLGLTHLLSVSGLHLVLAGALVFGVARRALRRVPPPPIGGGWRSRPPRRGNGLCALAASSSRSSLPGAADRAGGVRRCCGDRFAAARGSHSRRWRSSPWNPERSSTRVRNVVPCERRADLRFAARSGEGPRCRAGWRAGLLTARHQCARDRGDRAGGGGVDRQRLAVGTRRELVAVPWTGFIPMPIALAAAPLAGLAPEAMIEEHAARDGRGRSFSLDALAVTAAPRRLRAARPATRS